MNMEENELHLAGDLPELRTPVLLAGFAGWSDAGEIATYALRSLRAAWSIDRFAEIDPEEFYDFTETRPTVNIDPTGQRKLEWPENVFYAHHMPAAERDVVLLIGTEPQLRWRTYCRYITTLAERLNVSCLITLGGLLADVPHTREPTLTGFASTPRLLPQLQQLGVRMSSYEGPTGIIGALHEAWGATRRPAISLWGNVPHYITSSPNPQVTLAMLQRVAILLGTSLPISAVQTHARAFSTQVNEALQTNEEALEYVRQLEAEQGEEPPPANTSGLFEDLEQFLRETRPPEGPGTE